MIQSESIEINELWTFKDIQEAFSTKHDDEFSTLESSPVRVRSLQVSSLFFSHEWVPKISALISATPWNRHSEPAKKTKFPLRTSASTLKPSVLSRNPSKNTNSEDSPKVGYLPSPLEHFSNSRNTQGTNLVVSTIHYNSDASMSSEANIQKQEETSPIALLAQFLKAHTSIEKLAVDFSNIGDEGVKLIEESLIFRPSADPSLQITSDISLQELDIDGNNIGDEGAVHIAELIRNCHHLNKINLYSNQIGPDGCALICESIWERGAACSITELNISENQIGDRGCEAIASLLYSNFSIRKLDLSGNGISSFGAEKIFKAMKRNHCLTELKLRYNFVTDLACFCLGDMLRENSTLEKLSLYFNKIEARGCDQICSGLRSNFSLQELDLQGNNIGDQGCHSVAEMIRTNTTLNSIDVSYCSFGPLGANLLCRSLKHNFNLKELKMRWNDIGSKGCESLKKLISNDDHQRIQSIEFSYCCSDDFNVENIEPELEDLATFLRSHRSLRSVSIDFGYLANKVLLKRDSTAPNGTSTVNSQDWLQRELEAFVGLIFCENFTITSMDLGEFKPRILSWFLERNQQLLK